ncbi:MAG: amidase family protein, partial [Myxococcota bacterium]|nr:amidase family protein [Myxococcota bacterium]
MEHIFNTSGKHLAQELRDGKYSAVELIEAYIQEIQVVNPRLNAVVRDRFNLAREEAKEADHKLQTIDHDQLPPYLGVPCTVKESFQLSGMPNSAGLRSREQVIAKEDAVVVQRLRKSGAIPLGVTNTSELCMWM